MKENKITISFRAEFECEQNLIDECRKAMKKFKKRNPCIIKGQVMLRLDKSSPAYRELDLLYIKK